MIKKEITIKGFEAKSKELGYSFFDLKKIKHIVNQLYKIKRIDRREKFDGKKISTIVLGSEIGQKVLKELKEASVTNYWLMMTEQDRLIDIFGEYLDDGYESNVN